MSGEEAVQQTAEDAIQSKLECARKGYINDPFVQYFVRKPVRRAPLINRGGWLEII